MRRIVDTRGAVRTDTWEGTMELGYRNRREAGQRLATRLEEYAGQPNTLVLGLPRGGVPVAYEVARHLGLPLDVFVVRKLGVPGHDELAMGAIASGGVCVLNESVILELGLRGETVVRAREREAMQLEGQERAFRGDRPPLAVHDATVIVVDDGLATGATMRAAVAALRRRHAARIIVAVPVAAAETCEVLAREADRCICAALPMDFFGVGAWYEDFTQTEDAEVQALLADALVASGGGTS
jgi:putative phosphoribosyl transferase